MKRLIILLILPVFGCSHFICRPGDSGMKKTGKVSARVLTGICTIGITEIVLHEKKNEEIRDRNRRYAERQEALWWREYRDADPETREMMRYQREVYDRERYMASQEQAARARAASDALRAWSAFRASSPYNNRPVIFAPSY